MVKLKECVCTSHHQDIITTQPGKTSFCTPRLNYLKIHQNYKSSTINITYIFVGRELSPKAWFYLIFIE